MKDHPLDQFLGVFSGRARKVQPVSVLVPHETADVAAVVAEGSLRFKAQPFSDVAAEADCTLGAEFYAYGFPEDALDPKIRAMPRMFCGHFQRYFPYTSQVGYKYVAGELSMAAPPGLSGGPVFSSDGKNTVYGVVAENFDSTTTLESIEESPTSRKTVVRVISYGLCVMLPGIRDWLERVLQEHGTAAQHTA